MTRYWDFDEEAFEKLLRWLDADREQAGKRYEEVRRRLIKMFARRGCAEADDLADETINRVARKVSEIADTYVGDPALYFVGVARKVYLEHLKKPTSFEVLPQPDPANEAAHECLDKCLGKLTANNRELVLQYYAQEKQAKIDLRRQLADHIGIAPNALRIRLHRIRNSLHECINNCLEKAEFA